MELLPNIVCDFTLFSIKLNILHPHPNKQIQPKTKYTGKHKTPINEQQIHYDFPF